MSRAEDVRQAAPLANAGGGLQPLLHDMLLEMGIDVQTASVHGGLRCQREARR